MMFKKISRVLNKPPKPEHHEHNYIQLNPYLGYWLEDVPHKYLEEAKEAVRKHGSIAANYVVFRCSRCGKMKVIGVHVA